MFTVFDSKTAAYLPPFVQQTKGAAIRAFTDTCNDPNTLFNRHPEDYTLFHLGEFDDYSATFHVLETPLPIGKAIEFMNNPTPVESHIKDASNA